MPRRINQKALQAILTKDLDTLKRSLQEGDSNEVDRNGRSLLHHAVIEGAFDLAEFLISNGANVDSRDENGETSLHFAAREQNVEIAKLLILSGADVNARDIHGNTPLARAVFSSCGKREVIDLLNQSGANRDLKNAHGVSSLDLAKTISNYDILSFFNDKT